LGIRSFLEGEGCMLSEFLKLVGAAALGLLGLGFIMDMWYDEEDKPEFVKGAKKSVGNAFDGFKSKIKGDEEELVEYDLGNGTKVKLPKDTDPAVLAALMVQCQQAQPQAVNLNVAQ
jgi:hypothetical protein